MQKSITLTVMVFEKQRSAWVSVTGIPTPDPLSGTNESVVYLHIPSRHSKPLLTYFIINYRELYFLEFFTVGVTFLGLLSPPDDNPILTGKRWHIIGWEANWPSVFTPVNIFICFKQSYVCIINISRCSEPGMSAIIVVDYDSLDGIVTCVVVFAEEIVFTDSDDKTGVQLALNTMSRS